MFQKASNTGYEVALKGILRKTLVYGAQTLMAEFKLSKGSVLLRHSHPHEQTGYLIRGRMRLTIGNQSQELTAGDSWCIPGGAEHEADILEESVAIEVFSPVREDYLTVRNG